MTTPESVEQTQTEEGKEELALIDQLAIELAYCRHVSLTVHETARRVIKLVSAVEGKEAGNEAPLASSDHHDQTQNALLPCPFCGGLPEQFEIEERGPNFGGSVIQCLMCGASSPVHFDRKENLNSSWNTRTPCIPSFNATGARAVLQMALKVLIATWATRRDNIRQNKFSNRDYLGGLFDATGDCRSDLEKVLSDHGGNSPAASEKQ